MSINSKILDAIKVFLEPVSSKLRFLVPLDYVYRDDIEKHLSEDVRSKPYHRYRLSAVVSYLGKLGFKPEPAGKVRVFAMVDCWTQWLLFPLHQLLQDVLRLLKEDATFDQVGKLEKKIAYVKSRGVNVSYSFDLSSATDRLPVSLQV